MQKPKEIKAVPTRTQQNRNLGHWIAGQMVRFGGPTPYSLSAPGRGKSEVHRAVARQNNRFCLTLILSSKYAEEIAGYPRAMRVTMDRYIDLLGVDVPPALRPHLPEGEFEAMVPVPPAELLLARHLPSVVFFDELGNVDAQKQGVALEMIRTPPPDTWQFACGNPLESAADGHDLSPPMVNRVCVLDWEEYAEERREGLANNMVFPPPKDFKLIPANILETFFPRWAEFTNDFEATHPELFSEDAYPKDPTQQTKPWPSPRSWTGVALLMAACEAVQADEITIRDLVKGCVGPTAADAYLRFMTQAQLPDPEVFLANPDKIREHKTVRADVIRAILASIHGALQRNATGDRYEASLDCACLVGEMGHREIANWSIGKIEEQRPAAHSKRPRNGIYQDLGMERLEIAEAFRALK